MFGVQFDDQMSDKNIGENPKKQPYSTPSPIDKNPESATDHHDQPPQPLPLTVAVGGSPFLSPPPPPPPPPLYISAEQSVVNPKRPRFTTTSSTTGQWKLLPSPTQKQILVSGESTPPTATTNNPPPQQPQQPAAALTASSSDTANSSPSHSPRPSLSNPLGQDTSKLDQGSDPHHYPQQQQFRKGKYVSPVWKPNEMLWLARAWRVQYGGGGSGSTTVVQDQHYNPPEIHEVAAPAGRAKTRAEKDKEVAEFLNRHGVNRDAKTAGTKWDNMLGEFRKVYEWERGGERDQIGKSYFRLSPYERKLHRLPASFDEGVFEELSQFMGARMRTAALNTQTTSTSRGASPFLPVAGDHHDTTSRVLAIADTKSFPSAGPSFREHDQFLPFSSGAAGRGSRQEGYYHGVRGNMLGMDQGLIEHGGGVVGSSTSGTKELRRIGKIRMIWEEQVSLWAEEGEYHRGRVKVKGLSFLNADELAFLDESESMVPCTLESFEDSPPPSSPLKGFSVDKFVSGQQVKVFGRRKSCSPPSSFSERLQLSSTEPFTRSFISAWEFQDPTEYYLGCLRVPPQTLPSLIELPWYLQEPPPDELRFPLRKDVYRDLPQGKELLFATSSELFDCKALTFDILSPMIRSNPSLASTTTATSRDSFIGLWDDCINRVLSKFCNQDMVFIRKPSISSPDSVQDQWPNVTGFVKNYCLWRGEETDQLREGSDNPASLVVQKLLWSYLDIPYIFGYYAVGYIVTFCAINRSQDRIIRTDLLTVDLSTPAERIKALVPCWRIAGLLPLLADRCVNNHINNNNGSGNSFKILPYSDFEMVELGNGSVLELTPNSMTRVFSSRRKWGAAKEIYDFLDHRIPHSEYIFRSSEKDLSMTFKPRGCKLKPANLDQLVDALKQVTKALVALHDLSFMHRDLCWDKVMKSCDRDNEWFVVGFEEATTAPQMMYYGMHDGVGTAATGKHAPEMKGRGMHGVKVDVWGVGQLVKTCGLVGVPKVLRELQNRCLDHNPEQRPTAADCYHHLLQLQSSLSSAAGAY